MYIAENDLHIGRDTLNKTSFILISKVTILLSANFLTCQLLVFLIGIGTFNLFLTSS